MLSHAAKHCLNGHVTAIFSLEMGEESLNKRMISMLGKIDGSKMRNAKQYFNNEDWSNFQQALGVLSNMNIKIYDKSGQTVSYIFIFILLRTPNACWKFDQSSLLKYCLGFQT